MVSFKDQMTKQAIAVLQAYIHYPYPKHIIVGLEACFFGVCF